ncbi:dnaJ/Hsp40 cysteine-rich domain superfamily protein isoform X2 [Carex rostrata]
MANALSFTSMCPIPKQAAASSLLSSRCHSLSSHAPPRLFSLSSRNLSSKSLKAKESSPSEESTPAVKKSSILCQNCEGNGVKLCSQCEGSAVNTEDHFNGRFKAGGLCWLCRGRKEILCGDCNGAGFLGGFLSTFDETAN